MNTTTSEEEREVGATLQVQREQMLTLARRLDAFGRQTEQFLCQQLDQLERAIAEFESEKSAWRRQLQRESIELARARSEVQQLTAYNSSVVPGTNDASQAARRINRNPTELAARRNGTAPLRFLIQPGDATTMQVGLLMFEISKLNRDMGGRGVRFEMDDVRVPKQNLLTRVARPKCDEEILELTAYPALPLSARGSHVELDIDVTDRLEDWITFKVHLLQSSLVNLKLAEFFKTCKSVKSLGQYSSVVREAALYAESNSSALAQRSDCPRPAFWANNAVDAIRQQVARLENCYERLSFESRFLIHVELHSDPLNQPD